MLSALKKHRTTKGLTQVELAQELGVTRRSIIRWENHQTEPSMKKIEKMAKFFGCTVKELLK